MELGLLRQRVLRALAFAFLLLLSQTNASTSLTDISHEHNHRFQRGNITENDSMNQNGSQNLQRRQDNGFDFMTYFMGKNAQQQQQAAPHQVQQQQPTQIQQQHLLQQQLLQQQQQRQQEQLQQLQQQQLQQQQLIHLQQQPQRAPDVSYQDNTIQQQYQPQTIALNREGGYGALGIGNGYHQAGGYEPQPREIGISLGGGKKPVLPVGSILKLLPKIFNVLSGGGKVMFGVELGNNFYLGPVGAKPLVKLG